MRVIGDRVLVAIQPEPLEYTSPEGIICKRDPDLIRSAVQGIVVQVGQKSRAISLDDALELFEVTPPPLVEGESLVHVKTHECIREQLESLAPPAFDVAVGDCVVFPRYVGEELQEGELTYVVLRESEIIGIVDPQERAA